MENMEECNVPGFPRWEERLTRRNEHGEDSYLNCKCSDGCDETCSAFNPCRVEQAALDKLAAYEDTELSPTICAEYKKFEDEAISKNVTFNRIVELMDAEAEGRLLILTLNDPEIMGKDVFGEARIRRILDGWGKKYDYYFDALTKGDEADYYRQKLDDKIKAICKSGDFVPFEQRYDWLPEIRYENKR